VQQCAAQQAQTLNRALQKFTDNGFRRRIALQCVQVALKDRGCAIFVHGDASR
jgi:hypothetical protein